MKNLTFNEIKEKGLEYIDNYLENNEIVFIDNKYIILDINEYKKLKNKNLYDRYNEVYNKYKNGEILPQTANEHIQEIKEMLDV